MTKTLNAGEALIALNEGRYVQVVDGAESTREYKKIYRLNNGYLEVRFNDPNESFKRSYVATEDFNKYTFTIYGPTIVGAKARKYMMNGGKLKPRQDLTHHYYVTFDKDKALFMSSQGWPIDGGSTRMKEIMSDDHVWYIVE